MKDYLSILKKIVQKIIPEDEFIIFLFGSRAEKNNHDRSDIDLGIWGSEPLSPLLRFRLEERIENSEIPYLVDLVDFNSVGDAFKKEALQHIEIWNCPKNLKPILTA